MPEPENSAHRASDRHPHEDQLVDAMGRLRRCHPRVFDAIVVLIAHADMGTLDAVAEFVDFALGLGGGELAPSTLHACTRPREQT